MIGVPSPLPDKDQLEREQLYLSNEKLKIEAEKLEREAKPEKWWLRFVKNAVAIGGVATILATIYGVWESYNKTIDERARTRIAEQRTRFEDAIKRLESPSTISKLVGVSVLSGYLNKDGADQHRQILFTLASLMATEKDVQTQAAVIDLIDAIPSSGGIAENDWTYFQDILVSQSRALVAKSDLQSRRSLNASITPSDDESAARTLAKLIAINVRKGVLPNYTNYRGIYCAECNFDGIVFPRAADFRGAILDNASFNGASLEDSLFDNAELAGTSFVSANLRRAFFRSLETISYSKDNYGRSRLGTPSYVARIVAALKDNAIVELRMPKFNCAILAGANFDGHALIPGAAWMRRTYSKEEITKPGRPDWYKSIPPWIREISERGNGKHEFPAVELVPPTFFKADMKGAELGKIQFFTFSSKDMMPERMISGAGSIYGDFTLWVGMIDPTLLEQKPAKFPPIDNKENKRSDEWDANLIQRRLKAAFYSVELNGVSLPPAIEKFLRQSKPSDSDYQHYRGGHAMFNKDSDLDCKPPNIRN